MSDHRETVQQAYDAFGRGDIPTVLGLMDPQVQWRVPETLPLASQVGPEAVATNVYAVLPELFDDFHLDVDEVLDAGDAVVGIGTYRGTARATGLPLDADFVHLWRCGQDGRITSFRTHTDSHRWRQVLASDAAPSVPEQAGATTSAVPTPA